MGVRCQGLSKKKKKRKGAIEYLEVAAGGAELDCAADTIATMVLKARICLANIFR